MTRRAPGEGSVHRRKSGGWQGSINVGVVEGQRQRKTVYGTTQREVFSKLAAIRRSLDSGMPVGTSRPLGLGAYLEAWLEDAMPTTVRASTAASYGSLTRQHLIPGLGHHRLDKLTAVHVRAFLRAKSLELSPRTGRPLSARTLQYLHAVLRLALEQARRDNLVARNVAGLVAGPRVQRAEITPLSSQEAPQLLAASAADRLAALWLLVIALGLRRGEALALRWDDIDLERGHLQVRATLHRMGGQLVRDPMPKTKSSRRALPLPALVVEALKAYRSSQAVERMAARAWTDPTLVFTTRVGTATDRRTVVLVDSSVGINVGELPACHPLHSPDGSSVCLARYDYDLHDVPHHLNIRQAGSSRTGFTGGCRSDTDVPPWDAEQILAWMASGSFASDLQRRCGWPAALRTETGGDLARWAGRTAGSAGAGKSPSRIRTARTISPAPRSRAPARAGISRLNGPVQLAAQHVGLALHLS